MKKTSTLLCAGLATVCLAAVAVSRAAAGGAASLAPEHAASSVPAQRAAFVPYTLVQRRTYAPAGGQPFLRAEMTRLQRSDGVFAVTHTYYRPDGSTEVTETGIGFAGVGVFRADERGGKLEFLAPLDEEGAAATEDELKADPAFVREDALLGQRVLVARQGDEEAARYRESWRAPALRNFELKAVVASPRGTEVTEPVELRLGEPDDALPRRLAHLPRSFARFEERVSEAERRGKTELAERMRRRLERARR